MVLNISIIFCFFMFFLSIINERKILNPITVFFGEWFVVLFLSKLNLFGILEVPNNIYVLILIGCFAYAIGFYGYAFLSKHVSFYSKKNLNYKLNQKIVYTLAILTLLFFFIDFAKSAGSLMSGGLAVLRLQAQNGSFLSGNSLLNALRILIFAPFSLALSAVAPAHLFFSEDKNRIRLFIITLLIMLERLFSDGGRSPVIYLMFSFMICYFFSLTPKRRPVALTLQISKRKLYIYILVIFAIVLLYEVTLSRSGNNALRDTYYYFAMEPVMFNKWSNIVESNGLIAYGMASFNGILFAFFYILKNILGLSTPLYWESIYSIIEGLGTQWQTITYGGLQANSYASIFWTFYFDGRTLGIILGMLLYGIFVSIVYKSALNSTNQKNAAIYSLVLIGVFYTFQQLVFQNIYYSIAFLMLLFLFFKKTTH
ncbi:MAG: O-antigen polymerase [Staphylococcus hyicus]|uniref:O-antigen polymerase n=1 Tax=Staphylococcus hyicus TaxID=1284 RepID=UPI002A81F1FA|nr:O-antigen polymerase [Staphylococcus hyicus]MDY3697476.1 O-antigen polymerase [Staphylococcus hyicus]